jgi:serine/threonine protein phosphatase 1
MSKTWIIPDLHGCVNTLEAMIDHQVKPDKSDRMIFLGDYIDRGPDSKGVIDFIINLKKKGYPVTTLKGNHEAVCVDANRKEREIKKVFDFEQKTRTQKEWEAYGGAQTLKSFGVERPGEIPEKYIRWMDQLEYFAELDDFFAVHAGFNFWLEDPFTDTSAMIWIRNYQVNPEKIKNKKLIHGHVPVPLETIENSIKDPDSTVIDLDNGIYVTDHPDYGHLMALELSKMEYKIQPVIDEIRFTQT